MLLWEQLKKCFQRLRVWVALPKNDMAKTVAASSSTVFIRQTIPTTAKQNRLHRIWKRKKNSVDIMSKQAKQLAIKRTQLTSTGLACTTLKNSASPQVFLGTSQSHAQFWGRTHEPFK